MNISSNPSLSTRLSVWLRSIPFTTRLVLFTCTILFSGEFVFGSWNAELCEHPWSIIHHYQFYRLVTAAGFHVGVLHILLNMMSFLPLGATLERLLGTFQFMWLILLFDFLCGSIHFLLAAASFFNPLFSYSNFINECAVGFSGVIFGLLVVNIEKSQNPTSSVFGFFSVPAKLYPWVLLVLLQFLMPGISFLGHLGGILAGYLYNYGLLDKFILPPSVVNSVESSRLVGWLVMQDGYISNPHLGDVESRGIGSFSSFLPLFRPFSQTAVSQTEGTSFAGQGRVLGSQTRS